ncbi:hypothetical protein F4779DRAFT_611889 [Xylariaceae sp. FL0662B]|nr:hypothetical protein F4779DRAFT_611889 [Xylariaceae sp. FL0662B]
MTDPIAQQYKNWTISARITPTFITFDTYKQAFSITLNSLSNHFIHFNTSYILPSSSQLNDLQFGTLSYAKMTAAQPTRDFNSLPKELRDMIWDAAVRDDQPAAHFFSIDGREDKWDIWDDCIIFGYNDGPARDAGHLPRYRISAPMARPAGVKHRFSWTANNPSAYLQDGGLWTTCKESHEAMERRQNKRHRDVFACIPRNMKPCDAVNHRASMTGYFHNNGVLQYFAIGQDDLICFQPVEFDQYIFDVDVPFSRADWTWKPYQLQHFAFEFDPSWIYPENLPSNEYCWDQDGVVGCIGAAAQKSHIHIWFIDYGIQRNTSFSNSKPGDIRKDRQVFHGNGCRFVEVQSSDPEWNYPRLEGSALPSRATAFYFAQKLDEGMKDWDRLCNYEMTMDSGAFSEEIETREGAVLGVLACEYSR